MKNIIQMYAKDGRIITVYEEDKAKFEKFGFSDKAPKEKKSKKGDK